MHLSLSPPRAIRHLGLGRAPGKIAARFRDTLLRRRTALLGGTTTAADVRVAMRFLLDRKALVSGPCIAEYERAFARFNGLRYACSFSAGRVGLYGLLAALGVGPGDEVLLPAPTHIVVANAIRYRGAKPVYIDCNPDNYNLHLDLLPGKITPRTKALILQHTFGIPVDMDAALSLAQRYQIPVIEDCVHALGARYRGKPVGSFGIAAFFSTEETKTISTTMGGMVVTNDREIAGKLFRFRQSCAPPSPALTRRYLLKLIAYHLFTQPHLHRYTRAIYEFLGNWHPFPRPTHQDELAGRRPACFEQLLANAQAALGLRQLQRLEENLRHRAKISAIYQELLTRAGFPVPKPPRGAEPAYVRFPVWVENRAAAIQKLAPYLVVGTWFTSVLEEAVAPECGGYRAGSCPNAERVARHVINLPTHPRVKERDAVRFVSILQTLKQRPHQKWR